VRFLTAPFDFESGALSKRLFGVAIAFDYQAFLIKRV
jgi:hypothetical protein